METAEMRFLLGELSEEEKTRIEEAFFADDSTFKALELAEDELIDVHIRNELSPTAQRQFTAKLLRSPRLMERVNFARALAGKADSLLPPEPEGSMSLAPLFNSPAAKSKTGWWGALFSRQPAWGKAIAACAVLLIVATAVIVSGWLRLRNESKRLAVERAALERQKEALGQLSGEQRTRSEQLTAELQRERDQRAKDLNLIEELQRGPKVKEKQTRPFVSTFAMVLLTSGSLRSGGNQSRLTVGPGTINARVHVALEKNDYPTYSAAINNGKGVVVFRKKGLKPHNTETGPQLLLTLPAQRLSPDVYIVHVDGVTTSGEVESVSDYPFRVVKKEK